MWTTKRAALRNRRFQDDLSSRSEIPPRRARIPINDREEPERSPNPDLPRQRTVQHTKAAPAAQDFPQICGIDTPPQLLHPPRAPSSLAGRRMKSSGYPGLCVASWRRLRGSALRRGLPVLVRSSTESGARHHRREIRRLVFVATPIAGVRRVAPPPVVRAVIGLGPGRVVGWLACLVGSCAVGA